MGMLRQWSRRIVDRVRRRALDRETESEMRFHLQMEIDNGIRNGLTKEQATREAYLRAGDVTSALEQVRDQRRLGWLDGAATDLHHAWSALRRQPGFLTVAVGALAAAVAINTLIFAIVQGVLLQPLPYRAPQQLIRVFQYTPRNPKFPVSIYNYLEDKRENRTLQGIALYTGADLELMHGDRPERLTAVRITDDFFPTLGVAPALGRNFTAAEMHGNVRVVMLSNRIWRTRFNSDPNIAGRTIRLNREAWTVVGVLPAGFQHVGGTYRSPLQGDTVALWWPLGLDLPNNCDKNCHFTNAIARLKPGVSLAAASEDLNRIMDDLRRRFPDSYGKAKARVEPLATEVVGGSRRTIGIIAAAGAVVLLIAMINIAGLCIARVLARRRELSIRQALGGGAWRLVRTVLAENVILGIVGGAFGLALAAALLPVLRAILPVDFPRLQDIGFTWLAAGFAFVSALATSIVAGLVPALRQIRLDPNDSLNHDNRSATLTRGATRLRAALVAAEIALSVILCFGAVLLVRSANLLGARDQGFDSHHILTFQLNLPDEAYPKGAQAAAFYSELVERWRAIPGVRSAGLSTNLPWTGYDENTGFDIVGRAARPGESMQARYQAADPGYFKALHFRLIQGRFIEPGDVKSAPPVIVVNEALARRYFDRGDAVGHYLDLGDKCRIVGVVADIRDWPADVAAEPAFWWPLAQAPLRAVVAAIRTGGDPLASVSAVRAVLRSLDPELPMAEVRSMDDIASEALAERRFALLLCETFAMLAMALAAIGIYGMLSYLVEQRRREIGLRLALGATRSGVLWLVVSNALVLAAIGLAVGLSLAPLAGRAVSSMLYGVTAADVVTFAVAPLIILLFTIVGSAAPGWAAARTEPMSALRDQ